ncbi:MAG: Glu/Leu/Phe/Val family dehydrogenase [Myxococcota bacterium]
MSIDSVEPESLEEVAAAAVGSEGYDFFRAVQSYVVEGARHIAMPDHLGVILSQPKNEIIVHFPVRLDDGRFRLFKGYRIQHSNLLGPYKGGIRYHQNVSLDDVKALASMMTLKSALLEIPFGGAKGGVKFNPHDHSPAEVARITRRFTHALGSNIGPDYDIPAPDVGTNSQVMAWMMDTYMNTVGHVAKSAQQRVVTGKTLTCGGSRGRDKATAQGLIHCVVEWARENRFELEGKTAIVQGYGNVGSHTALLLAKLGVSIVAVGDHSGYRRNTEGFNPHKLADHVRAHGSIAGYDAGHEISREEFFATPADIFVPAALENQVGPREAELLQVRLVAEGANGPVNPDGERALEDRGVAILPDILTNSGGVTVSYYEWVQNKRSEQWDLTEVERRLEDAMRRAYYRVMFFAREHRISPRLAAYGLALQSLDTAYRERGIFP